MGAPERGIEFLDKAASSRPRAVDPAALRERVLELHATGLPSGAATGWHNVDALYTVVPGQLTIVTGWPSSGKSEWVDALLVNLARSGWKTAMYSPENQPTELHASKLIEKIIGKPFGLGPTERMTPEEADKGAKIVSQRFALMEVKDEGGTIQDILDEADSWLSTHGAEKRGLVIDPWNEVEHWRPPGLSETEYVSKSLAQIRRWARNTKTHVWLVAHPQKVPREGGKLPMPRPDHISGSQNFWNKADVAITVYRDLDGVVDEVEIHVLKVRFKHVGRTGMARLNWSRVCGRYSVPDDQWKGLSRLAP